MSVVSTSAVKQLLTSLLQCGATLPAPVAGALLGPPADRVTAGATQQTPTVTPDAAAGLDPTLLSHPVGKLRLRDICLAHLMEEEWTLASQSRRCKQCAFWDPPPLGSGKRAKEDNEFRGRKLLRRSVKFLIHNYLDPLAALHEQDQHDLSVVRAWLWEKLREICPQFDSRRFKELFREPFKTRNRKARMRREGNKETPVGNAKDNRAKAVKRSTTKKHAGEVESKSDDDSTWTEIASQDRAEAPMSRSSSDASTSSTNSRTSQVSLDTVGILEDLYSDPETIAETGQPDVDNGECGGNDGEGDKARDDQGRADESKHDYGPDGDDAAPTPRPRYIPTHPRAHTRTCTHALTHTQQDQASPSD
jgi:hypothetical protein